MQGEDSALFPRPEPALPKTETLREGGNACIMTDEVLGKEVFAVSITVGEAWTLRQELDRTSL